MVSGRAAVETRSGAAQEKTLLLARRGYGPLIGSQEAALMQCRIADWRGCKVPRAARFFGTACGACGRGTGVVGAEGCIASYLGAHCFASGVIL